MQYGSKYTKRYFGEKVYSFCEFFLNCNFQNFSQNWWQKVESSNCGWETKKSRAWTPNLFGNQSVCRGFLNHRASRNTLFPSQMMASLMWSKRTCTIFVLEIRIAVLLQNFFDPVANYFFVFITYLTTLEPSWVEMATRTLYYRHSCNMPRNMTGIWQMHPKPDTLVHYMQGKRKYKECFFWRRLSSSSSIPHVQSSVHRGKVWEVRDHRTYIHRNGIRKAETCWYENNLTEF